MSPISRRLGRATTALLTAAFLLGSLGAGAVQGATVTDAWQAKVGRSGVNGTVRVTRNIDATGAIAYRLKGLRASTTLPVVIHKGTCSSVGAVVVKLASVRSTSAGAVARTTAVTASQIKLIAAAGAGSAKLAIRIGTGTGLRCGALARISVPPYVAKRIAVGYLPLHVAVDGDNVWVTNWADNTISRVSASTNASLSQLPLTLPGNQGPDAIAVAAGSLWVTTTEYDAAGMPLPGSLLRIDPGSGAIQATLPVGRAAWGIAVSPGAVWVSVAGDGVVHRIDTATNQITATVQTGGAPIGIAYGEGAVWVANAADGRVHRIDPATNAIVATIQTQLSAVGITVGGGAVWASNYGDAKLADGKLTRIDPLTNQVVTSILVGIEPGFVTFAGGSAWVSMDGEPTIVRVSAASNTVTARVGVAGGNWGIAAGSNAVWSVQTMTVAGIPVTPGYLTRIAF